MRIGCTAILVERLIARLGEAWPCQDLCGLGADTRPSCPPLAARATVGARVRARAKEFVTERRVSLSALGRALDRVREALVR